MAREGVRTKLGAEYEEGHGLVGWILTSLVLALGLIALVAWMCWSTPPPQGDHGGMLEPARFVIPQ